MSWWHPPQWMRIWAKPRLASTESRLREGLNNHSFVRLGWQCLTFTPLFPQKKCKNAELDKSTKWLHRSKACMPLRLYGFQVISKILWCFFDIWSLVKRSHLTHMCWGLKPPKIFFLISKDHQCLATLELTKHFFLNCKAKKADTCEKSWEGVSLLDGFQLGILNFSRLQTLNP